MKHLNSIVAANVAIFLMAGIPASPTQAQTATAPLVALEASPSVLPADGTVTVSLPADFPTSKKKLRLGIWEQGRTAYVGDIQREFTLRDGKLQATVRVEGDPGSYELRLLTNDKRGAALSQPAKIILPGIQREPGWWLLNGSPFYTSALMNGAPATGSTAPLFVAGLKRDLNSKAKVAPRNVRVAGMELLPWRTFNITPSAGMNDGPVLPQGIPLLEIVKPDFDFNALSSRLSQALAQARAAGQANYLGITVQGGGLTASQQEAAKAAIGKLRGVINQVAPEAALILRMPVGEPKYHAVLVNAIDAVAPMVDAVEFITSGSEHTWPIKAARRVAEEQANYDLPLFIHRPPAAVGGRLIGTVLRTGQPEERHLLGMWMGGATGLALQPGDEMPRWAEIVTRNSALFIRSVTFEDIGLLPAPLADGVVDEETPRFYTTLRSLQRIPLLARSDSRSGGRESFFVSLGEKISREAIAELRSSVSGGGRIYVEGSPETANADDATSLSTLLGGTVKRTAGSPKQTSLAMDEPWMFGLSGGLKLGVSQQGEVTPIIGTVAGQAKSEKGKDVLTGPRVVAKLADGTPGLIINPVEKGEVVWLPHRIVLDTPNPAVRYYYTSIAAYLQAALVQVRTVDGKKPGLDDVTVALRASSKGTIIVALFNGKREPIEVAATMNARAETAFDLDTEKELPFERRGNHGTFRVTIPGNGWKLVALAGTRKEFDNERNAKRLSVKLK